MTQQDEAFDYHRLNEALERVTAMAEASEAHGILCGLLCAEGKSDIGTWLNHVVGDKDPDHASVRETRDLLLRLHDATLKQITDGEYALQLLMRSDEEPLEERVSDLSHWCQGFLVGLSLGGVSDFKALPEEAAEITRDMLEISRVGFDGAEDDREESEAAFAEIVEYVRMGVFVIYSELNPDAPMPPQQPAVH